MTTLNYPKESAFMEFILLNKDLIKVAGVESRAGLPKNYLVRRFSQPPAELYIRPIYFDPALAELLKLRDQLNKLIAVALPGMTTTVNQATKPSANKGKRRGNGSIATVTPILNKRATKRAN